jgi:hypothetical protein
MKKCMQCGYERQEKDDIIDSKTCPRCGIIYDKWQPDSIGHNSSRINNSNTLKEQRPANTNGGDKKRCVKYAVILSGVLFLIFIVLFILSSFTTVDILGSLFSKQQKRKPPAIDYFEKGVDATIWVGGSVPYKLIDDYKWITVLYKKKDFAAIEKHIVELLNGSSTENAIPLNDLYDILGKITDEKHIITMENVLHEWCRANPNSHIPWLVRGEFYLEWAWFIRGDSKAKNVTKEAWPQFYEKLELAKNDLEHSYKLNPHDANSSATLITVSKGLGYSRENIEQYFQNGVAASPLHYETYLNKLDYLSPRWHGTKEEMMQFAKYCSELSNQNPLFGLILATAYQDGERYGESKDENAPTTEDIWQIIDKSYSAYFQMHPNDIAYRFNYALWAATAKKYDFAIKQFEIIGNRWMERAAGRGIETYNASRAYSYFIIGWRLLYNDKQYDSAIDYIQTALQYKKTANAYSTLGVAYWHKGHDAKDVKYYVKAREMFEKALELDANHKDAKKYFKQLKECNL